MPLLEGCCITTRSVSINSVKHGDTVLHSGVLMTVSKSDINSSEFMGATLFGDSYNLGLRKVTLVKIKGAKNG